MLDVPNFFWDSEPTLYPLYIAVREYLEIKPRIQVLNERCRVVLDLIEILSDSIADSKMSRRSLSFLSFFFSLSLNHGLRNSPVIYAAQSLLSFGIAENEYPTSCLIFTFSHLLGQTWIIIILILVSIVVTISEVILRFGILSARSSRSVTRPSAMVDLTRK
jgi:hypothetical protein